MLSFLNHGDIERLYTEHAAMKKALEETREQIRKTYFRGEAYYAWEFYLTVDHVLTEINSNKKSK